jgi:signal transduction histidine kinase
MHIPMQNIGVEKTQLSECRYALMLGVETPENRLADFMQFACAILNIENSVLSFEKEPYLWHASSYGFQAVTKSWSFHTKYNYDPYRIFSEQDDLFSVFLDVAQHINDISCQRLIGFKIQTKTKVIGQLFLYDDQNYTIEESRIRLVESLVRTLIHNLKLYADNAILHDEYEQQVALNFSKNKYLQILSHDLRAPFHGLLGFTDVLINESEELTQEQRQDIINYLNDTLNSTYDLLESVLKWSMADGGRFVYHPINFKLKEASSIVFNVLSSLARKKNIEICDEVDENIQVYADIHMITSVIQNLVSNALKFSLPNQQCKVTISAKLEGDIVHISVQDDGLGMSKLQVEHLFLPDLNATLLGTSGEIGSGLGLMLCKRFVELNLGVINVRSEQTKGSTFTVSLPMSLPKIDPNDNLIIFKTTS